MQQILLATSIAAVTEALKRLNDKDYRGAVIIAIAGGLGALFGAFSVEGLTIGTGIVTGLGIAGVHTIAKQVG